MRHITSQLIMAVCRAMCHLQLLKKSQIFFFKLWCSAVVYGGSTFHPGRAENDFSSHKSLVLLQKTASQFVLTLSHVFYRKLYSASHYYFLIEDAKGEQGWQVYQGWQILLALPHENHIIF